MLTGLANIGALRRTRSRHSRRVLAGQRRLAAGEPHADHGCRGLALTLPEITPRHLVGNAIDRVLRAWQRWRDFRVELREIHPREVQHLQFRDREAAAIGVLGSSPSSPELRA